MPVTAVTSTFVTLHLRCCKMSCVTAVTTEVSPPTGLVVFLSQHQVSGPQRHDVTHCPEAHFTSEALEGGRRSAYLAPDTQPPTVCLSRHQGLTPQLWLCC